jgi:hypothetical protein
MSSVAVRIRDVFRIAYPASSFLDLLLARLYDFIRTVNPRVENGNPDSFLSSIRYNSKIV